MTSIAGADDKAITFKPVGRATFDWVSGSENAGLTDFNDLEFDTVNVGGTLSFQKRFHVKIQAKVNEDELSLKEAYVEIPIGDVRFTVGHTKVPNGFNWHTSGASKNFMERPHLRRAFGVGREFGARLSANSDNWGWDVGVFSGDINDKIANGDWTIAGRAYTGFVSGQTNWFVGASARYREKASGSFDYDDRPYARAVRALFEYEGGTSDTMLAGELAFERGAFYGVTEAAVLRAKTAGQLNQSNSLLSGYVELGYNLSGEHAKLDFRRGAFGKTKVASPVTSGGLGLWQLAIRYDVLDLTAQANTLGGPVLGGLQKSTILALNWNPTKHMRVIANLSSVKISRLVGPNQRINAFGLRLLLLL